jgi:hypothetical protein
MRGTRGMGEFMIGIDGRMRDERAIAQMRMRSSRSRGVLYALKMGNAKKRF